MQRAKLQEVVRTAIISFTKLNFNLEFQRNKQLKPLAESTKAFFANLPGIITISKCMSFLIKLFKP